MTWQEFKSLLQGIGPDTPLARVVQIRLETDKDILKNFTSSQHKIRDKWLSHRAQQYSKEEINTVLEQMKNMFISLAK